MRKNGVGGGAFAQRRSDRSDALLDLALHRVERQRGRSRADGSRCGCRWCGPRRGCGGRGRDSRAPCGRPGNSWPSRNARPARRARDWCRAAAGRRRRSARPPCPRAAANGNIAPCRCAETLAGRSSAPGWCRARSDCRDNRRRAPSRRAQRAEHQVRAGCSVRQIHAAHISGSRAATQRRTVKYRRSYLTRARTINARAVRDA